MNRLFTFILMCVVSVAAFAQLPSAQLKTLDGKAIDTATLNNDGKPFVISFFATWCKPCNRELKAISEVYADWQDETGMKLYAISIDQGQNINKVKPLVDAEGWEYDVLLDPNSDFKRALGIQMIPHVLIVDGNGKIVDSRSGYTEGAESHLIEKIREVLKDAPAVEPAAAPETVVAPETPCCCAPAETKCETACEGKCDKPCDKKCEGKCDKPCDKKCEGKCDKPCDKKCEGKCDKPCDKKCEGKCDKPCDKKCEGKCNKSCEKKCEGKCNKSCEKK